MREVYAVDLADAVASVESGASVVEDHAVDLLDVTGSRCFAIQCGRSRPCTPDDDELEAVVVHERSLELEAQVVEMSALYEAQMSRRRCICGARTWPAQCKRTSRRTALQPPRILSQRGPVHLQSLSKLLQRSHKVYAQRCNAMEKLHNVHSDAMVYEYIFHSPNLETKACQIQY